MSQRTDMINEFYGSCDEDQRLVRSRHGQLEFETTMHYIHKYTDPDSKILEIGAGTGRYSISLAKEGRDVTAVELVNKNLDVLKLNGRNIKNLKAFQADAVDLSLFGDDMFDLTLVLGPLYHLYERSDVDKAIDEAIRVTKPGGTILFAFLSVYAMMNANYLFDNWAQGENLNFTDDYKVRHIKEQLFTGYDITEFEDLFSSKPVEWITTIGVDGMLEQVERLPDFSFSDEDFASYIKWYLNICEKRELLGNTNHLLYICKKA